MLTRLEDGMKENENIVELGGNPWAEPPEAVVKSGLTAVARYFDDLFCELCSVRRNSVKVVLVGKEGAGKTR